MKYTVRRLWLAVTTALTCSVTPALAQDAGEGNDIIVTARRTEERLQDVPISITVLNDQAIANRNIVTGQDLATYVPSLSANGRFGAETATFAIRGFTQENFTSPSVGVYFADVIGPRANGGTSAGNGAGPGQLFDIQNVQVLKGPQGTLFGRNTTGGAVLIVPTKPTDRLEGYVEGSVGDYSMRRFQGVINVPLAETFKVRLGLDRMKRDGYIRNRSGVGPRDYDDTDYWAARLAVVAELTPDLENYMIARYSQSRTNGPYAKLIGANYTGCDAGVPRPAAGQAQNPPLTYGYPGSQAFNFGNATNVGTGTPFDPAVIANYNSYLAPAACGVLTRQKAQGYGFWEIDAGNRNPFLNIEQWGVINTTTWQVSDALTIKNILSYQEFRQRQSYDVGHLQLFLPAGASTPESWFNANLNRTGTQFPWVNINPIPGLYNADQSTFTEELQLQGRAFGGKLNYVVGGYYEHADPIKPLQGTYSVITYTSASPAPANVPLPPGSTLPFLATLNCSDQQNLQCVPVNTFGSPFIPGLIQNSLSRYVYENIGLFAQGTYNFSEQLSVTGGFRYTIDTTEAQGATRVIFISPGNVQNIFCAFDRVTPAPTLTSCVRPITAGRQRSKKPTWLISTEYKPMPDVLLYAKYSRGYRQGNINASNTIPQAWGPEKVDAYEIGAKASFRGSLSGYFNVAGFYNDFSDQQLGAQLFPLPGTGASPAQAIINAGKSKIQGVEIDALFNYSVFSLAAGYTYLDTKLKSFSPNLTDPAFRDYFPPLPGSDVGGPLPLSPKHKLTLTPSIRVPIDESIGTIILSGTYVHQSVSRSSPAASGPSGLIPAFDLINLNAAWNGIGGLPVDVAVFVTNVTNEKYYVFAGGGWASTGYDTNSLGQPRIWGARLRYRFGAD